MNTIGSRIAYIRKELGLSQEKFAESVGLTKNWISLVETGKNNFSDQSIKIICNHFGINEKWLLTGEGEPFLTYIDEEMYILEALRNEINNPMYEMIKNILFTYRQLDETDKLVIKKFAEELLKKNGN